MRRRSSRGVNRCDVVRVSHTALDMTRSLVPAWSSGRSTSQPGLLETMTGAGRPDERIGSSAPRDGMRCVTHGRSVRTPPVRFGRFVRAAQ